MNILIYLFKDIFRAIHFIFIPGKWFVDDQTQNKRLSYCNKCPHKIKFLHKFKRCGICGCFLNFKTRLSFEECPDLENQKWSIQIDESR